MKAIINGKIITEKEILENKVLLFDEKVHEIVSNESFNKEGIEVIDAKGNYVSPGFIDVHIHGSNGKDAMDGEMKSLEIISEFVSQNGVTAFLPTTMTMSKEKIYKALDIIREAIHKKLPGASVIGAHLEGPFISERYKGAQKKDYIIKPSYDFIERYKDIIKIITMAPEEDHEFQFIKKVKENTNIVLSIGHSDATYEEAIEAIECGVSHITHLFNAMSPLHHRKPGVVGAAFNSDVACEIIADKIHINPKIFSMLIKIKGKEKMMLITDCMRAGGLKDGVSELGGQKVFVKDNSARLEDGTLAGSILTLNKAIKNIYENTNLTLNEAVNLATINPARDIKIDCRKGSLEKGKDADITIFNDKFEVLETIVGGRIVYEN
ncbi:N-acetylglucosamine-6-phosphate deacetylase [Clostridium neuense]|uniref:N-acetylglucosamine-6-phosphate deacetylase n=1 Tax=Clostridium neuense TaxID=1728934 RepID=A0ABW8TEU9_9CLOT